MKTKHFNLILLSSGLLLSACSSVSEQAALDQFPKISEPAKSISGGNPQPISNSQPSESGDSSSAKAHSDDDANSKSSKEDRFLEGSREERAERNRLASEMERYRIDSQRRTAEQENLVNLAIMGAMMNSQAQMMGAVLGVDMPDIFDFSWPEWATAQSKDHGSEESDASSAGQASAPSEDDSDETEAAEAPQEIELLPKQRIAQAWSRTNSEETSFAWTLPELPQSLDPELEAILAQAEAQEGSEIAEANDSENSDENESFDLLTKQLVASLWNPSSASRGGNFSTQSGIGPGGSPFLLPRALEGSELTQLEPEERDIEGVPPGGNIANFLTSLGKK
ncbi:MAG: hypothetical protein EA369_09405 [Bradymonadales bacterium]|nr:MAG: hypothetical protein EA369_09405 [Bradymonadales bacterium]